MSVSKQLQVSIEDFSVTEHKLWTTPRGVAYTANLCYKNQCIIEIYNVGDGGETDIINVAMTSQQAEQIVHIVTEIGKRLQQMYPCNYAETWLLNGAVEKIALNRLTVQYAVETFCLLLGEIGVFYRRGLLTLSSNAAGVRVLCCDVSELVPLSLTTNRTTHLAVLPQVKSNQALYAMLQTPQGLQDITYELLKQHIGTPSYCLPVRQRTRTYKLTLDEMLAGLNAAEIMCKCLGRYSNS